MYVSISMRIATWRTGSPMRACPTHAPTCAFVRERACLRVGLGARASAPQRASTFHRRGLRVVRQVFLQAPAFNANIGAWNTARVTKLFAVCAAHTHYTHTRIRTHRQTDTHTHTHTHAHTRTHTHYIRSIVCTCMCDCVC